MSVQEILIAKIKQQPEAVLNEILHFINSLQQQSDEEARRKVLPSRKPMKLLIGSKPMTKWDRRFCDLAEFVAGWSKDPNAKVGAVVCSKEGGAVSIGYNGFPMGVEDSAERLQDKEIKLELIVHAEQNAIIAAGSRSDGAALYVWGKPICARCAGCIIQAGVRRVVALSPDSMDMKSKWRRTAEYALQMFTEAGVKVDFYTMKNEE